MAPDEWMVECVKEHRVGPEGQLEFHIKWDGFDDTTSTGEPASHLCNEALAAYMSTPEA